MYAQVVKRLRPRKSSSSSASKPARESGIAPLRRGLGRGAPDQVHRLVLEDSTGGDFTAEWRRGGRRDPGGTHRGGVRQGHMAIQPADEHGIVRRDGIDPPVLWQRIAAPQRVIPIAAGDPLAWLESCRIILEAANEHLGRRGIAQVHGCELKAAIDEVRVPVREARHDEAAGRLQHFGLGSDVARDFG